MSCSVSNVATSCMSGYYLSGTTCTACATSTTSKCNDVCLTSGFYSSGDSCK